MQHFMFELVCANLNPEIALKLYAAYAGLYMLKAAADLGKIASVQQRLALAQLEQ